MLEFFKKLFGIENKCCCGHCNYDGPAVEENIYLNRKDYRIIIPQDIALELEKAKLSISATKHNGKTSCVQMFKTIAGKSKYKGTLKDYMNVKSFKDGDVCNFSRNNLIYKKEK